MPHTTRTLLVIGLGLALAAFAAAPARGATLRVPQDFPTIQAALDAALTDDVVLIRGGVYAEAVSKVLPQGVTIRAQGNVRIDATGLGAGLLVVGQDLQLIGLKVVGGTAGFGVGGANALVSRCTVSGVTGDGFIVGGGHTVLDRCRVLGAGGDGIAIVAALGPDVEHCAILDAQGSGLTISSDSAAAFVFESRILRPGVDGLVNNSSGCVVEHVTIAQSAGRGIVDKASVFSFGNSYIFNSIVKPAGDGFFCSGGKPDIQSSTITRPGGTGINVSAAHATIQHNKVKAAGGNGLRVAGVQAHLDSNRSTDAVGNGFVLDSTGNVLTLNRGSGSGGFDLLDNHAGTNTIAADNVFGTVGP